MKVFDKNAVKRYKVFKKTQDNWHPSFELDDGTMMVAVSLIGPLGPLGPLRKITKPYEYRVCVWGDDDMGMELDSTDEEVVVAAFFKVLELEFVNYDNLKAMGFVPA